MFDFSNFEKGHVLHSKDFKKIPFFLKLLCPKTVYLDKLIALRSKVYAYDAGKDYNNKLKGI